MSSRTSVSSAEELDIAARITRSASDSSLSISSQVLIAASAVAGVERRQQRHRVLHALAAAQADLGQAHHLLGDRANVVEHERLARVLQQVEHVVHRVDQAVDLLAVDRRDEGL